MATEGGRGKPIQPINPSNDPQLYRNKTVVRRILDAFNTGDTKIIDEVTHPDLISHTPKLALPPDKEGLKRQIEWLREHFPDAKFEEEEVLAEGDVVYLRWKMTGTHQARFLGR